MATLTVKNVGPIREANIEVKKHTIFIGPQGTGKSTLAKLIAICSDQDLVISKNNVSDSFERKYGLDGYIKKTSELLFTGEVYEITFLKNFKLVIKNPNQPVSSDAENILADLKSLTNKVKHSDVYSDEIEDELENMQNQIQYKVFKEYESTYIPAERILISTLSNSIWALINADLNLPKSLTEFSRSYESSRSRLRSIDIPFLRIEYNFNEGNDEIKTGEGNTIELGRSASGYQSIVPLLLVVERQRQQARRRFVVEEPELNLYPTAQKDLIYSLVGGLDPKKTYQDAEWVITTHSPYVLTSYNTLILAYKVAQRSDELRAEVDKIIPSRYWINPDDFAAYYVDNGTARSITSEKTGMINDSELDNMSEDFAGEQDQLLNLYRSVPSA